MPSPNEARVDTVVSTRAAVAHLIRGDPDLESWCDDRCIRRYLRARPGNPAASVKMLKDSINWRAKERPQDTVRKISIAVCSVRAYVGLEPGKWGGT